MRTIIAGSRTLDYEDVAKAMSECGWTPTVILSGGAAGVDQAGERWAKENNIELEIYPAKWEYYGKSAGYIRNALMVSRADAAVIIWDGKSKGSLDCAKKANKAGLKVFLTQAEPKKNI